MTNYASGRRAEYRCQRILEAAGYTTARMAGSHGMFDVIAWNGQGIRFIQVKAGIARLSAMDREAMTLAAVPACASREYWRFMPRQGTPEIEVL